LLQRRRASRETPDEVATEVTIESARVSDWVENRPGRGFGWGGVHALWEYRELLLFLAVRDLKVRYKQAVFGIAWAAFQPLAGVAVFTVVFHQLAGVDTAGVPYPIFAFAGLAAWSYVSTSTTESTESLVRNAALVTKVYFPRAVAPVAATLPGLVDLLVSLIVLAVLMLINGYAPGASLLALPLAVAALLVIPVGVGLWLSALNVQYRDIRLVIAFLIQLWLFASPVAYPIDAVPERWRLLYACNPAVGGLDLFRWSLLATPLHAPTVAVSLLAAAMVVISGFLYFHRVERRFADVI
jgi:lipopolysaccharide transport system permease protein